MSGWFAGAAVVGAVVTGVATNMAASKAAKATQNAANTAAGVQYKALDQQQTNAAPYMAQGQSGIQTYNSLTSANPAQVQQTLESTPGYQATYGQGTEAAMRAAGASGMNLSGNQIAGVEQFGAQLGDSTYQQAINNALGQEQIGQGAAAGQSANIGQAASNLSNIAINQGNNMAAIQTNEIAGITRAGSSAANALLTYNTLQGLNNPAGGGGGGGGGGTYNAGAVTGIGQPVQDPYTPINT
jgi:hypothetical protein